ncbi:unnamed protein product [Albugo candida]|uniref:Cell differentiation protein rcd1 n=1 Tax=Albugo candida TaxID=65357 RepID=A0A024GRY5_9STRA|nr:unnamed protein product [Albugo candida]|eukprot:CCI49126.1 unnamed protein product [Albugo candida]
MESKTSDSLHALVLQLSIQEQRESALLELSKKREEFPELAPILWHSFGTIAALLQEIVSIYPLLSPPQLTAQASNRACNALALLQCVASHYDTRTPFLNAHIPLYLYPFLNTVSKNRPFEYLRLTSLGVIGALVKIDDPDVINFLLQTEIIPLCLRIMEAGSELSKTVATFIVQKILLDEMGLTYICHTPERFYAVGTVLSKMVNALVEAPSVRLLKHIIRCYLRLADNIRAKDALGQCLPEALRNHTFDAVLKEDTTTSRWLTQLLVHTNAMDQNIQNISFYLRMRRFVNGIEFPLRLKRKCRNENNLLEWKVCFCDQKESTLEFTCGNERVEMSIEQLCAIQFHTSSKTRFIILYREVSGRTMRMEFMASSISLCRNFVQSIGKWCGQRHWKECEDNVQEEIDIVKRVQQSLQKLEKENWELQCQNVKLTAELTKQNENLRSESLNVNCLEKKLREKDFEIENLKLSVRKAEENEKETNDCNSVLYRENKMFREKELEFLEQQEIMCAHIRRLDALVYGKFSR